MITGGIESDGTAWIHSESDCTEQPNMMFCDDFRQRLPADDPVRIEYEESIRHKAPDELRQERVRSYQVMHEIASRLVREERID